MNKSKGQDKTVRQRPSLAQTTHQTETGGRQRPLHHHALLQLQQQMGNNYVQHLLVQRETGPETPDQQGRQLHEQALAHFSQGQYAEALALWRQVYGLSQLEDHIRRDIAFNMGTYHLRLGQNVAAIDMWQEYLLFADADQEMALENIRRARTDEALPPPNTPLPEVTPEQQEAANEQAQQAIDAGDAAADSDDPTAALEHYRLAYSLQAASSRLRWRATWRMGFAHRQLRQFEQAISIWQESMGFPEADDADRQQAVELIRQARQGVVDPDEESITAMTEEEQQARFQEAREAMAAGQYETALAGFRAVYAQPTAASNVRQAMAFNMALCLHRLQRFAEAISLYEEYLLFPGITADDRAQALAKIRQCRMQEIGLHISPTDPDTAVVGSEREIFTGFVYFDTGSHDVEGDGQTTLKAISQLLSEQHAAHPDWTFHIVIVGASTRRWRAAGSEAQADAHNRMLAEQRATSAATFLTEQLPSEEVAAGLYQTETSGTSDDVSEIMGLDPDDNSWTERHAAITVLVRE